MNRLHIDQLVSVGVVEAGDNEPSQILFWKRKPEPEQGHVTKERDQMPFDIDALPDDARAYISELEAKVASAVGEEPAPALPDDLPDVVAKRLQAQDDAIEKERVEKERIAKELADLREERDTERYNERAAQLRPVLGPDMGPVLKALGTADPDAFAKLDAQLEVLRNLENVSEVLKEYGDPAVDGSAVDQINAYASEIRKAQPDMSLVDARAEAWRQHPELKRRAREEG